MDKISDDEFDQTYIGKIGFKAFGGNSGTKRESFSDNMVVAVYPIEWIGFCRARKEDERKEYPCKRDNERGRGSPQSLSCQKRSGMANPGPGVAKLQRTGGTVWSMSDQEYGRVKNLGQERLEK